jgi:hypothetical protein
MSSSLALDTPISSFQSLEVVVRFMAQSTGWSDVVTTNSDSRFGDMSVEDGYTWYVVAVNKVKDLHRWKGPFRRIRSRRTVIRSAWPYMCHSISKGQTLRLSEPKIERYEVGLDDRKPEARREQRFQCEGELDIRSETWRQIKWNIEGKGEVGKPRDSEKAGRDTAVGPQPGSTLDKVTYMTVFLPYCQYMNKRCSEPRWRRRKTGGPNESQSAFHRGWW